VLQYLHATPQRSLFDNPTNSRPLAACADGSGSLLIRWRRRRRCAHSASACKVASKCAKIGGGILRTSCANALATLEEGPRVTCPLVSPSEKYAWSQSEIELRASAQKYGREFCALPTDSRKTERYPARRATRSVCSPGRYTPGSSVPSSFQSPTTGWSPAPPSSKTLS
jgi:hypothetical protein